MYHDFYNAFGKDIAMHNKMVFNASVIGE